MLKSLTTNRRTRSLNLNTIRNHIAEHMIGNAVDLLTGSKTILHGTVTGVLTEAGKPKLVVNGHRYDMNQVLTVLPATL
jgi:hypothetical protein